MFYWHQGLGFLEAKLRSSLDGKMRAHTCEPAICGGVTGWKPPNLVYSDEQALTQLQPASLAHSGPGQT